MATFATGGAYLASPPLNIVVVMSVPRTRWLWVVTRSRPHGVHASAKDRDRSARMLSRRTFPVSSYRASSSRLWCSARWPKKCFASELAFARRLLIQCALVRDVVL